MPSLVTNNVMETNATLPHLIRPKTSILPVVRSRSSLREALRLIQPPRRGRMWVCFTSGTHQSTHAKLLRKSCPKRSAQILPAREKSATMLHATSCIPGNPLSSNVRLSLQLPIISTRTTLVFQRVSIHEDAQYIRWHQETPR